MRWLSLRCLPVLIATGWLGETTAVRAAAVQQPQPTIRLSSSGGKDLFEVTGIPRDRLESLRTLERSALTKLLQVRVSGADLAILGTTGVTEDSLVFRPRFPLTPGLSFQVICDLRRFGDKILEREFTIVKEDRQPVAVVEAIYPSSDVLPENLLKFYIHFSEPMSQVDSYRHVALLDDKGQPVDLPFLELAEELWDSSGKRFTLFIDPGRIKRGVKPLEEVGPALVAGRNYTLVVDRDWRDALGEPLRQPFRKNYRVARPLRKRINPGDWVLEPPKAATQAALRIRFSRPLDHALLQRTVWVTDSSRRLIPTQVRIGNQERSLELIPDQPWNRGEYQLEVDSVLEDLAGNSVEKSFEVDVFDEVEKRIRQRVVRLHWRIRE